MHWFSWFQVYRRTSAGTKLIFHHSADISDLFTNIYPCSLRTGMLFNLSVLWEETEAKDNSVFAKWNFFFRRFFHGFFGVWRDNFQSVDRIFMDCCSFHRSKLQYLIRSSINCFLPIWNICGVLTTKLPYVTRTSMKVSISLSDRSEQSVSSMSSRATLPPSTSGGWVTIEWN